MHKIGQTNRVIVCFVLKLSHAVNEGCNRMYVNKVNWYALVVDN